VTASSRTLLSEHEGLTLAERLGLGAPPRVLLSSDASSAELEEAVRALSSDRVVLKAQVPGLVHKTEAGGVVTLAREADAVQAGLDGLRTRFRGDLTSALLQAFVPHADGVEGELLIAFQDTPEYGPVLTVGPGGTLTEFWAEALGDDAGPLHLSPYGWTAESLLASLESRPWFRLVTEGVRGRGGGVAGSAVVATILDLLGVITRLPAEGVVEAEFNPVAVTAHGLVALDAVVWCRERPGPRAPRAPRDLSPLLEPDTIAIMGASARGMNPGRIILCNTLAEGYPPEQLVIVKPGESELDGCRCVDDLADLGAPVDLLVLALPAAQIPDVLSRVAREALARSVILIPGGLGEVEGTQDRVDRIRDALRDAGESAPLINGANCLGVRSVSGRVNTLFIPRYKLDFPDSPADPLALISQSGAFAVARLSGLRHLNPELVVTVGNQLDLTLGDYLTHLTSMEEIRVVAVYAEGFRPGDGARFLEAARELRDQGRCVVLYRAGRTTAGKDATASHTASMTGDFSLTSHLARGAGVLTADTVEEFTDLVRLAMAFHDRPVGGRRLGAVSNAGFESVGFADHVQTLELPPLPGDTRQRLQAHLDAGGLRGIVSPSNPMDLTPMAGDGTYEDVVRTLLTCPDLDLGVVGCVPLTGALQTLPAAEGMDEDVGREDSVARRLERIWAERDGIPWICVVDGGELYDPMAASLQEAGIPVFRSGDRAARVLARYVEWRL